MEMKKKSKKPYEKQHVKNPVSKKLFKKLKI